MRKTIHYIAFLTFAVIAFMVADAAFAAVPAPCAAGNVRWAGSSNRIYITGNVACTLTEIKAFGSSSMPLELVDPVAHIWFLGANMFIGDGAQLILHGTALGGDVDELRIKSNNTAGPDNFVIIQADWGSIDINTVTVTSWDEAVAGPDTELASFGRAHIRVRSRLDADGVTPHESRMDIQNSDIGYLGYNGSEAYGLSWKVIGKDTVGLSIFDTIGVYGDVVNNTIHHNYFGVYTYGAEAMTFVGNEVYENSVYGIDPHDDSDFLIIDGNFVHHNGGHGIICSRRCNDLTITNNTSTYNGGNGIMLHRNVTDSLIADNNVLYNIDSGIALFEGHNNTVSGNTSRFNERGIRLSVGSSHNTIEGNVFSQNNGNGIFLYKGTDIPTSGDGRVKLNTFRNNDVNDNGGIAVRIKASDDNTFESSEFTGNHRGLYLSGGSPTGNSIVGNIIANNGDYYNVKLYSAPGTTVDDNTISGSKYGVLLSTSNNSEITNNHITSNDKTGIRLQNGSSGNLISGNTIEGHVRGIDILGLSESNIVSNNQITNNTSYAAYLYNADNNTFKNNILTGNALNYYYAKFDANNTVEDSDAFAIKLGDTASTMAVTDSVNTIFHNSKKLSTTIVPAQSSIALSPLLVGKSVVSFSRFNFTATPASGNVTIRTIMWNTSGDLYKKWKAINNTAGGMAVSYVVGDLTPGVSYDVIVNGNLWNTFTADSNGEISFDFSGSVWTTKTFEVKASI